MGQRGLGFEVESIVVVLGLYRDTGRENGNHYRILELCRV